MPSNATAATRTAVRSTLSQAHMLLIEGTYARPDLRDAEALVETYTLVEFIWVDAGLDVRVFGKKVQQVGAVDELDRLTRSEFEGRRTVSASRHQDSFGCALILQRAVKVTDCRYVDRVAVALG